MTDPDHFQHQRRPLRWGPTRGGTVALYQDLAVSRGLTFASYLTTYLSITREGNEYGGQQQGRLSQLQQRFPAGWCVVSPRNLSAHSLPLWGSPPTLHPPLAATPLREAGAEKHFLKAGTPCPTQTGHFFFFFFSFSFFLSGWASSSETRVTGGGTR